MIMKLFHEYLKKVDYEIIISELLNIISIDIPLFPKN